MSALGWTQTLRSTPGPGARSPYRCTSRRNPANASWPVTFCSMIAGTSDSMTRPLRPSRAFWWRRQDSSRTGCRGSKPVQSSKAPSRPGTDSSAHSAPSPQASACTSPFGSSGSMTSVAGPSGVRIPRQTRPRVVDAERRVAAAVALLVEGADHRTGPVGAPHPHLSTRHVPDPTARDRPLRFRHDAAGRRRRPGPDAHPRPAGGAERLQRGAVRRRWRTRCSRRPTTRPSRWCC